jgi:hypothetical protein
MSVTDAPVSTRRHVVHDHDHFHGRRLATETKAAFKTTEFAAFIAVVAAILISAAAIKGTGAHKDAFTAAQAWLYIAIVTAGYLLSRGLAKSGSRQPYDERS